MKELFTTIISPQALAQALAGERPPRLIDCRARLGDPAWGKAAYLSGHLPGAVYADLDADLADPPDDRGRHPLPERERWAQTVRQWGIGNDDQVVVYDDAGGAFAARAWWMFRWLGHAPVAVLDGGLAACDLPVESTTPDYPPAAFETRAAITREVGADRMNDPNLTLTDARAEARWSGREEPIDPVAGHIPGASCLPFQGNLADDGRFLPAAELAERFAHLDDPVVCYCGSGVTACHNILAMCIAGLEEPYLYPDSWSGWITDPERPIARA